MTSQTLEQCLTAHGYDAPDYSIEKIKRFSAPGKPKGNKSAWLKVFSNGNAVFGDWTTGERHSYSQIGERLPKAEYIKFKQEQEKERKHYQARLSEGYRKAACIAQSVIDKTTPAPANHPYLIAKGIQPHGALYDDVHNYRRALIIPVYGTVYPYTKKVQSLQFIMPDGSKRFLSGGRFKGGYCIVQQVKNAPMVICEGFSTGATIAEYYAQESSVICAFNAGNLLHVARWYRQQFPISKIIIAGDNDCNNRINTGKEKAIQAAKAIAGTVSIPEFSNDETGSDWNDRYRLDKFKGGVL